MKRCSLSLAIRKVQIKIPLWHNCELIRIARIKNSINNGSKSSQGYRDSGSPKHWWGCKMVQPLWIRIWYLLKKLNEHLPRDLIITHLAFILEKWKFLSTQNLYTNVYSSSIHTHSELKIAQIPSMEEWLDKLWHNHTLAIKRNHYWYMQRLEWISKALCWLIPPM